jgi:hypothetical protein
MKPIIQRLIIAASLFLSVCINTVFAQDLAGAFINSGLSDANKLVEAYLSSTSKGVGQGMNDGWHNTAKPLGLYGFDLRFNVGFGFVPEAQRTYNINNIGLNTDHSKPYLVLPAGTNPNQPTLYGNTDQNPPTAQVRINVGGLDTMLTSFTMPTGSGYHISPSLPMVQASFGVPFNTEINLRFFPQTKFLEDYSIGLFGIGFKHDIIQWLPAFKDLSLNDKRPIDCSVYMGYTRFNASYNNGKPILEVDPNAYNPDPSITYNNQEIAFSGNAFTIGTLISKEIGVGFFSVSPFAGINYAYSMVDFRFKGDYPLVVPNDEYSLAHPQVGKIQRVKDPIQFDKTLYNMRINVGVRAKFTLVTLSTEYSIGQYNTMSVGLGLNMQSLKPVKI